MRTFQKSRSLDNVRYDVRGVLAAEAERLSLEGNKIIKLNIGNPAPFGFCAPDTVISDMLENLRSAEGYTDSKGLMSARCAIVEYCRGKNIPVAGPEDVITGNGVSELIAMSMHALLNSGDEVLVPSPDYPLWTAAVSLSGGKAVHYVCDEQSEWNPDTADIKKKITPRTKAIVIINPNNPTGALYPDSVLSEIADIARSSDLIVFSDEIYDRIVMDGLSHTSIAALAPDLFTVTMNGLSKSHNIAGFRCGWMTLSGNKAQASGYIEGLELMASMRLCANVPAQLVVASALKSEPDVSVMPGGRLCLQRDFAYSALNRIPGVSAVKPKAGLYIFPKLDAARFGITDDERFALDFLREKHVLIVHGTGFHWSAPDHFRVVYLPCIEDLGTALGRLEEFLSEYRQ